MKNNHCYICTLACIAWAVVAQAQQAPRPEAPTLKPPPAQAPAEQLTETKPAPPPLPLPAEPPPTVPVTTTPFDPNADPKLRLNFRGVPLDMVLNYLSEAAGFIIIMDTPVEGKVDVWSNQPLNKNEAVDLLNTILNQNGYAAIRNGRTLRIVSRENAKKFNIPVQQGNDPEFIPKTDEMVTQIIPIRYANAPQMTKDLQQLLPTYAALTANESGNALVLTATQADVRRMTEIVQALDTSIANISTIRVFPLRYADATKLAVAVKEVFTPPQQNNSRNRFSNRFGGGGGGRGGDGPGGFFGGGGEAGAEVTGQSAARDAASRVVAVADERSNALIVAAPDEFMPALIQLVKEIDVSASDITELRVFPLKNSDPEEMADILTGLFPDETQTNERNGPAEFRFGPGGFRGGGRNGNTQASSERAKKEGKVVAVPDLRTSSLIVSAAGELMPQIAEMITQLDSSVARKQKVFVYSLENADVREVEQILRDMFQRTSTQNNRNTLDDNSALSTRSQQNQNQLGAGSTIGSSRTGGQNGGLNGGGNQTFR